MSEDTLPLTDAQAAGEEAISRIASEIHEQSNLASSVVGKLLERAVREGFDAGQAAGEAKFVDSGARIRHNDKWWPMYYLKAES